MKNRNLIHVLTILCLTIVVGCVEKESKCNYSDKKHNIELKTAAEKFKFLAAYADSIVYNRNTNELLIYERNNKGKITPVAYFYINTNESTLILNGVEISSSQP